MSPRAAWRLEGLGFERVYDYVPGKADWFASGLPFRPNEPVGKMAKRMQDRGATAVLQRRAKRLASYARRAISTQQSAIWSPTAES
jgi:hypothetical protein